MAPNRRTTIRTIPRWYDLVSYADPNFLKLFLCGEVRGALPPKVSKAVQPERVDRMDKIKTSLLKFRGLRWFEAAWPDAPRKTLSQVINQEASFKFRPYSFMSRGVSPMLTLLGLVGLFCCSQGRPYRSAFSTCWVYLHRLSLLLV